LSAVRQHDHEAARLRALERFEVLDTKPEPKFDRIVDMASRLLDAPISLISLVDGKRQWFKARIGFDIPETPRSIAFCAHAIETQEVMIVEDATQDPRFAENPLVTGSPEIRFYAGAPLTTDDGYRLGTLCVIDRVARTITADQQTLLRDLAAVVVDELELRRANSELRRLAATDPMTGAANRRSFFTLAKKELARARRRGHPTTVLILDIDHFKGVNDTYGHEAGDRAIVALAGAASGMLRREDIFARLGGEEFAVLLPETDALVAHSLAERLRTTIRDLEIAGPAGLFGIAVSIGLSAVDRADTTIDAALRRADAALYEAKRAGRDCVRSAAKS